MATSLPPGARVVPLHAAPTPPHGALSRASPALTRIRAAHLLPDTTARAQRRVQALKRCYVQPMTRLRDHLASALEHSVRGLRLTRSVRNVRVTSDAASARETGAPLSVVGSLCMPFHTCCALPVTATHEPSAVVVTGSVDGLLTAWDVDTCSPMASASSCEGNQWGRVRSLAPHTSTLLREDGAQLFYSATMFDRRIGVWALAAAGAAGEVEAEGSGGGDGGAPHPQWRLTRLTESEGGPPQHIAGINALAVDPTGSLLASAADDATLRLWSARGVVEARGGEPLAHLGTHDGYDRVGRVLGVSFHPDGSLVATADAGGRVVAWDTRTGGLAFSTVDGSGRGGHVSSATCVAWSPCGVRFASGGTDTVVQLWDARYLSRVSLGGGGESSGAPFHMLGHSDTVTSLSFYADPHAGGGDVGVLPLALVSTSLDGTVRLWDADTGLCAHTLAAGSPVRAHCRPVPANRVTTACAGERCSAAAMVTVGHGKHWSVWDVLDGEEERGASTAHIVRETDTVVETGRWARPTATTASTTEGGKGDDGDEEEDDDDDEDEMALLKKVPQAAQPVAAAQDAEAVDSGTEDDDDDEMEMLKKKRRS